MQSADPVQIPSVLLVLIFCVYYVPYDFITLQVHVDSSPVKILTSIFPLIAFLKPHSPPSTHRTRPWDSSWKWQGLAQLESEGQVGDNWASHPHPKPFTAIGYSPCL